MKYVNEGYLPNYPYHLISDDEMCDAFIRLTQDDIDKNGNPTGTYTYKGYFFMMYPLLDLELNHEDGSDEIEPMAYSNLVKAIHYHIYSFKNRTADHAILPDWIYSYMLGPVISVSSPIPDIHDVIEPIDADNEDDFFEGYQSIACYKVSRDWNHRVVHKEEARFFPLRLNNTKVDILLHPEWLAPQIDESIIEDGVIIRYTGDGLANDKGQMVYTPNLINLRPPTMFGEPHVVKAIRISMLDPMMESII